MVIQSNMSPAAVVEVWAVTEAIFKKYQIPMTKKTIETVADQQHLAPLLQELNAAVGSSSATCTEGG